MDSVSLRRTTSYYVAVPCCSQSSIISAAVGGHGPLSYRRGRATFSPDIGLESKRKKNKVKSSVIIYDLLRFFLDISVRLSNIFFCLGPFNSSFGDNYCVTIQAFPFFNTIFSLALLGFLWNVFASSLPGLDLRLERLASA